jgi:hypothetical protein
MLFRKILLIMIISLLSSIQTGYAHGNKPVANLEIGDVIFNPPFLKIGHKPNRVTVTVKLIDTPFTQRPHVLLLKQIRTLPHRKTIEIEIGLLQDKGMGPDKTFGDGVYSGIAIIQQKTSDEVKFRVVAEHKREMAVSEVFTRLAGSVFKPGQGGTVQSTDGIIVTIPPDSIPYEAQVAIVPAVNGDIKAPVDDEMPVVDVVKLIVNPVQSGLEVLPMQKPLQLSFPAPDNLTTSNFIVAQEIEVPIPGVGADKGGFFNRLTPVDNAVLDPPTNRIVTETTFYDGILGNGLYVLLANFGSNDISGHVCEGTVQQTTCTGTKVPSVVVSNDKNTLVAVTNSQGEFTLHISGNGNYELTAFDSLRGFSGTNTGKLPQGTDVVLSKTFFDSNFNPALFGIRNGGFECVKTDNTICDGSWGRANNTSGSNGVVELVQSVSLCSVPSIFGPDLACPASGSPKIGEIKPSEGQWMASISTGINGVGKLGSVLTQRFKVPKGAKNLYFDYIFLSEEFNEYVNSIFNDTFHATVTLSNGTLIPIKVVSVNSPGVEDLVDCPNGSTPAKCLPAEAIFNCGFPDGDVTCGKIPFVKGDQTATIAKWVSASINLSLYAGQDITLDLAFTTVDQGDDIYDTQVLLDNIRFSTLFLDVNVVAGVLPDTRSDCNTPSKCVQNDLVGFDSGGTRHYGANEILSEAGLNLRTRSDVVSNLVVDSITGAIDLTNPKSVSGISPDAKAMLTTNRGTDNPQNLHYANVFYVRNITNSGPSYAGMAFTQEDDNLNRFTNDGVVVAAKVVSGCDIGGHLLAHELGHLLMPDTVDSSNHVEHNSTSTFMSQATSCKLTNALIVSPDQQQRLNSSTYLFIEP